MKDKLVINTEISSYFLWEYTKHVNALDLWYCAEDIGFFLAKKKLLSVDKIETIVSLEKDDREYIGFIRHIAFRIFCYTTDNDKTKNWFASERLLQNGEWVTAIANIATIYSDILNGDSHIRESVRSEKIRRKFNA